MKKSKLLLSVFIGFVFILGVFSYKKTFFIESVEAQAASVKDERELKAVWVSSVVSDVMLNGESTFKNSMNNVLDIMEYYGMNALIFHVRTHNNALYPSSINPKAVYISNINFNTFDPIEWLIAESHKRGIEFHAWMNPYRISSTYTNTVPSSNPQYNSTNVIEGKILNPALSNVKNHIYDTIDEFVTRYPTTDAIHFDDYFYVSTSASPTSASARRGHIDDLIEGIHTRLKQFNQANNTHVQFGISPTGIYKNGNGVVTYDQQGKPISTGSNTRGQQHYEDYLYADTVKWISEGWLDYIMPQVYWARDLSAAPFNNVLSWWDKVVEYLDVNLYSGIGLYKALETGGAGWYTNNNEMNAQFNIIEDNLKNVKGYSIFAFKNLKAAHDGDTGMVGRQVNNAYSDANRRKIRVLPEIRSMTKVTPGSVSSYHSGGKVYFTGVNNAKFYYIYASSGELTYSSDEIIGVMGHQNGAMSYTVSNYNSSYNYGVRALSPTNHLSPIAPADPVEIYNISYNLNGGTFNVPTYETRDEMILDFLTDFYNFVQPEVNLTTFIHGPGKTSGYDGLYDGDYFNYLFRINDKSVNASTGKFINQPQYNKWVTLLDLMDEYTHKGYEPQYFWNSLFVAQRRIKPFIQQVNLWEEDGEPKASIIMEILNRIPCDDNSDSVYYQYTKNYPEIVLPNVGKEGYTFLGWYTSNTGGIRVTSIPTGSTGDKIFYARWQEKTPEAEEVLVNFNLGYENKTLPSQTITKGTIPLKPNNPSRTYYAFTGWYLNGSLYNFDTPINSNITLVAGWDFNAYSVKFLDYNGALLKEEYVASGGSATAPSNPSRVGYTFIGWDKAYRNVYEDLNVYATYSVAKYFVEFYDSDGTYIDSSLVEHNNQVFKPSDPIKEGQNFKGWYLNDQLYDFSTPVTGDIVLYAWWDTSRFTVTFLNENGSIFLVESVEEGAKVSKPSINPRNDGFTFNTWVLDNAVYNFNNNVYSNITLTPTWDVLIHTIRFLDYDRTEISRQVVEHEQRLVRPSAPLRYGYTFIDWYLGDLPYNFNYRVYESFDIIARYDINKYQVRFIDYDGSILSIQEIAHGSSAIAPVSPNDRDGYQFAGWSRTFNNVTSYLEVIAVYSANKLFVEFHDDNNEIIDSILVDYGTKAPQPNNPYKAGYVFAGWLYEGVLFDFNTTITKDIVLIASFEVGGHVVTFLNDDGSIFIQQSVVDGTYASKPVNNPKKEGYDFLHWKYNGSEYNFNTKIYNDITLTPSFSIFIHTIRFINDDGSVIDVVNVEHAKKVSKPMAPVKAGHSFEDWYLGDLPYNFNFAVYESFDLYARWTINEYTVRFFDYDGTLLKTIKTSYGMGVTPPNNPNNKAGHYFDTWDKSYNNITSSVDITALYKPFKHFVEFVDHNDNIINSHLVEYGSKIDRPNNPFYEGHSFVGWFIDGEEYDFNNIITKDIVLKAKWEIKEFSITFLDRGEVIDVLLLKYKEKVVEPSIVLTREGFNFSGWFLYNELYDFDREVEYDITLNAGWTLSSYTVTFLNDDGTVFETQLVSPGEKAIIPKSYPIKEGYVFNGWLLRGLPFNFNVAINSSIMLSPSYNTLMYDVKLSDFDGTLINTISVVHGTKLTKPNDPTKEGHTFSGWYLGDELFDFNNPINENKNLIARWNIITFTVRFYARGILLSSQTINYNENAIPPAAPPEEDYVFTGWDKDYFNVKENLDILAVYAVKTFTVTFKDLNGVIEVKTVQYGKSVKAPTPTNIEGYTFTGWDNDFTNVKANLIINGLYEKISLTVFYYDFYNVLLKQETVFYGDKTTEIDAPRIEGASFLGWLYEGESFNFNSPVKDNLILHANYLIYKYTVRFLDYNNQVLKTAEVLHGESVTPPADPTRDGYVFAGWDKDYSNIKSDIDIKAKYVLEDVVNYNVTFKNEDDEVLINVLVAEGNFVSRPADPIKSGYSFNGWYLEDTLYTFNTPITKDIDLIAKFDPNRYRVTYKDDKGVVDNILVEYNNIINVPNVPSKVGYFGSWDIDLEGVLIKKDYTIEAVYILQHYNITYHNTEGLDNPNPTTHTIIDIVELKPLPAKEGNNFVAWYDELGTEIVVLAGAGDKTLYARFEVSVYVVTFVDYLGAVIDVQHIDHEQSATAPIVPDRKHYKHTGFDRSFTNVRNDITVKALYEGLDYELVFNTNGGNNINKQIIKYPNLPTKPNNPTRDTYNFDGWYISLSFGKEFNFDEPLIGDTTIYAKWNATIYIVTFLDNFGNVISQKSVEHGKTVNAPIDVNKEHYNFIGWDNALTNITKSQTINAIYEGKDYVLTFDTGGGSLISPVTYKYPKLPIEPQKPEKEGYDFLGFYVDNKFRTRFNFDEPLKGNTTVYAKWVKELDDNKYVSMFNEASIRYKTTSSSQGLRFSARLDEDVKYNEHGFYLVYGYVSIEDLKIALTNQNGNKVYINGKEVIKTVVEGIKEENTFSVVVTGVPEVGYADNISAIAYVVVGGEYYYSNLPTTKSILEVGLASLNKGETHSSLNNILDSCTKNMVFGQNAFDDYELNNTFYEYNHLYLKEEFYNDFYSLLMLEFNLDTTNIELKTFYNNPIMKKKWTFLLDYFSDLSDEIALKTQISRIKANSGGEVKDLTYTLYNFFNEEANKYNVEPLDFSNKHIYEVIKDYNNNVYINSRNYEFYQVGDKLTLPVVEVTDSKMNFDYYLVEDAKYYEGDLYTISNNSVKFIKEFKEQAIKVTFILDGDIYYERELLSPEAISFPYIYKSNYEFLGWYTTDDKLFSDNNIISRSITLKAKFKEIMYIDNIIIDIDKDTYELINCSSNITVNITYDFNYVNIEIIPGTDYQFSFNVNTHITFSGEVSNIVYYSFNPTLISYTLSDPK